MWQLLCEGFVCPGGEAAESSHLILLPDDVFPAKSLSHASPAIINHAVSLHSFEDVSPLLSV